MNIVGNNVFNVLRYFAYFNYSPTFEEIHTFLKKKCSKPRLAGILEKMIKEGVVKGQIPSAKYQIPNNFYISNSKFKIENDQRYTLGEYSIDTKNQNSKIENSIQKIHKVANYIKLLSFFPQIQLVGLSGTVSMMNAEAKDDIDLFVITEKNRLWTGRLICLISATLLGLRRKRNAYITKDKVCLNLFFDKSELNIPKKKQTEYIAHEVLQMKPLINKNCVYEQFLAANRWVYKIFPNAHQIFNELSNLKIKNLDLNKNLKFKILNYLEDWTESLLKYFQLHFINRHRTTEIITLTQLWFFPEDFEKKISPKLK